RGDDGRGDRRRRRERRRGRGGDVVNGLDRGGPRRRRGGGRRVPELDREGDEEGNHGGVPRAGLRSVYTIPTRGVGERFTQRIGPGAARRHRCPKLRWIRIR